MSNLEDIKNRHRDNRLLFDLLFMSTSVAVASFLIQFKSKQGVLGSGKAAWDGMATQYQSPTRQRRRLLKQELTQLDMNEGQDPDVFVNEIYYLSDELIYVGDGIQRRQHTGYSAGRTHGRIPAHNIQRRSR